MNKFIITGNLTKDPEMRNTQSGKSMATFSVAVQRPFNRDEVDFFNAVCFGKTADNLVQYQSKGNKILVEGEVQITNKDGKYFTNVVANNIEFLTQRNKQDKPQEKPQESKPEPFDAEEGNPIDVNSEDLPF